MTISKISYDRMVDSPVGSLLGCYVFNKKLTKEEALEKFQKAYDRNNLPTPQDINEAYNEWIAYFDLPYCDNIYAFRNEYTFRFAIGISNDEGQYGFFPLQSDGVYTFFERMFINPANMIFLKNSPKSSAILDKPKRTRIKKDKKETE